jgi:hypothetical protein
MAILGCYGIKFIIGCVFCFCVQLPFTVPKPTHRRRIRNQKIFKPYMEHLVFILLQEDDFSSIWEDFLSST